MRKNIVIMRSGTPNGQTAIIAPAYSRIVACPERYSMPRSAARKVCGWSHSPPPHSKDGDDAKIIADVPGKRGRGSLMSSRASVAATPSPFFLPFASRRVHDAHEQHNQSLGASVRAKVWCHVHSCQHETVTSF